jgi:predicted nuclease of predicted toxin-antitoxin system
MKLLLDECVTRKLKRDFATHEVHTIEEAGLKGLENGTLLRSAAGKYDVLITVDRNMEHQQNIVSLNIAILVLAAKKNDYAPLRLLVPQALNVLNHVSSGEIATVS